MTTRAPESRAIPGLGDRRHGALRPAGARPERLRVTARQVNQIWSESSGRHARMIRIRV
jgi:hypothetical protein